MGPIHRGIEQLKITVQFLQYITDSPFHFFYASASRGVFLDLRKSIIKTKFIINMAISIINTTIPVVGFAAMVPGSTTAENQMMAAVTVIQSRYAGIITIFALILSRLV